jgi:hypothetical protein
MSRPQGPTGVMFTISPVRTPGLLPESFTALLLPTLPPTPPLPPFPPQAERNTAKMTEIIKVKARMMHSLVIKVYTTNFHEHYDKYIQKCQLFYELNHCKVWTSTGNFFHRF